MSSDSSRASLCRVPHRCRNRYAHLSHDTPADASSAADRAPGVLQRLLEGDWAARTADVVATSIFRWIYTLAPLAPRSFTKVAKANGVAPLRTVASLLTADRNLPFAGMGLQPEQTWHVRARERRGNALAVSPKKVSKPEFVDAVQRVLTRPVPRRGRAV